MARKRCSNKDDNDCRELKSRKKKESKRNLPRLRVLSLFDGIGTGFLALQQLKFDVEVFYASEIDKDAMMVTQFHFLGEIKQLGSVTELTEETLQKIGTINLLIGGSPCNDLSAVNYRKKGLYDITGSGILFFEYYRIWCYLLDQSEEQSTPFYWLYENVASMELANRHIISKFFKCEPTIIDSIEISPQRRRRLFWSNFPNIDKLDITNNVMYKPGPKLDDYLEKNLCRQANLKKIGTITTKRSCLQDGKSKDPVRQGEKNTGLLITEIEKVFGLPPHYTDVGNITINKRQKLLGKAWSCQVIKNIFQLLDDEFSTKRRSPKKKKKIY